MSNHLVLKIVFLPQEKMKNGSGPSNVRENTEAYLISRSFFILSIVEGRKILKEAHSHTQTSYKLIHYIFFVLIHIMEREAHDFKG